MVHHTFFVYYSKKLKKYKLMIGSIISLPVWCTIFFLNMNKKNYEKGAPGGPTPISLWSEYSSSNWFHSNTPNSRHLLIQMIQMDLIHFHSKNIIKIGFPKSCVFQVSKLLQTFIIHRYSPFPESLRVTRSWLNHVSFATRLTLCDTC